MTAEKEVFHIQMKIEKEIWRQTVRIAIGAIVLATVTQGIILALAAVGRYDYDYTVPLGSLLGVVTVVLNFFLMGYTIQKTVSVEDPAFAKRRIQVSYTYRSFAMLIIMGMAFVVPVFDGIAAVVCVFYPRLIILFMQVTGKLSRDAAAVDGDASAVEDKLHDGEVVTHEL